MILNYHYSTSAAKSSCRFFNVRQAIAGSLVVQMKVILVYFFFTFNVHFAAQNAIDLVRSYKEQLFLWATGIIRLSSLDYCDGTWKRIFNNSRAYWNTIVCPY